MLPIEKAVYGAITGDAPLMTKLSSRPPYPGRLPEDVRFSRTVAAMHYTTTAILEGNKWNCTMTLVTQSLSHDLNEAVAADLRRLFHKTARWVPLGLGVGEGKALSQVEFITDEPSEGNEVFAYVTRLRVRYAA